LTGHTLLSVPGEDVNDLITCQRAVSRWLFYFRAQLIFTPEMSIREDRLAFNKGFRSKSRK